MQNKDIEIFLELVNTRNITKASENLFMSQSVISTRLKKLEEELGYELFLRAKGMREIELTRPGKEFIGIAARWRNLYEEAAILKDKTQYVLRIAFPESVYFDFFEPLLMRIIKRHPQLKVEAQTGSSVEIYRLMELGVVDYGFASYEASHSSVVYSKVYEQPFCLVSNEERLFENDSISPESLDPEKEIRLIGGNFSSVSQWRDNWFPCGEECRIEVDSPHMVVKCIKELGNWAILPEKTARLLAKLYGVHVCQMTDTPKSREIYLLRHARGSGERTDPIRIFEKELAEYLHEKDISEEERL